MLQTGAIQVSFTLLCRDFHVDKNFIALVTSLAAEQDQSEDVDNEPRDADVDHTVDLLDLVRVSETLDGLDEDCEAESDQEDRVDESTEYFSTCPAERVLRRVLLGHLITPKNKRFFKYPVYTVL